MRSELMVCPRCWGRCYREMLVCDRCEGRGLVPDVRLSRNFMLSEFLRSDTATGACLANEPPNDPGSLHVRRLRELCEWLLQPVRDALGPLRVTSGYRSLALNVAVKGSKSSAHVSGWAADVAPLHADPVEVMRWLPGSGVEWDQAILYPGRVHLGLKRPSSGVQRRELLVAQGGRYPAWRDAA